MIEELGKISLENKIWLKYKTLRYIGTIIPCNDACSWVVDHARLKQKE